MNYDAAEPEDVPDSSPQLPGDREDSPENLDTAQDVAGPREPSSALPPKLEAWRRRSATGAILTGLALGFQQALEAPREQATVTIETSGTPPRDLPVDAEVEVLRPRQSIVSIRPWLLDTAEKDGGSDRTLAADQPSAGADDTLAADQPSAGPDDTLAADQPNAGVDDGQRSQS